MERRGENICLFIVFMENCPSLRFKILEERIEMDMRVNW